MKEKSPDPNQDDAASGQHNEGPSPISDSPSRHTEPQNGPSSACDAPCMQGSDVGDGSLDGGNRKFPSAQEQTGNLSVPVEKYLFGRGTMEGVTKEMLGQIWKTYLEEKIADCGGVREMARKLHFKNHNSLSKILKGDGFLSPRVIVAIATYLGPSVGEIYFHIAGECVKAEAQAQQYGRVQTRRTSAPVPSGAEEEVARAIQEHARDERLHPKGRPAPAGESEDVPPLGLHEEAGHRSSRRS